MIYTSREKLAIIELDEYREEVTFEELEAVLWEYPSNMIYVETAGKITGLIGMSDIDKAVAEGKGTVTVNTRFTSVLQDEYMRARDIFMNRPAINVLPVICRGELLGDYSRWDDLYRLGWLNLFFRGEYVSDFFAQYKHVAMVYPNNIFEKKMQFFTEMKKLLEEYNIVVDVINRRYIMNYIDKVDRVLFVDEAEKRGILCLYRSFVEESFDLRKCETYCQFTDSIIDMIANTTLKDIQNRGVKVVAFNMDEGGDGWIEGVQRKINEKFDTAGMKCNGILRQQWKKAFFEGIYSKEYEKQIMPFSLCVHMRNGLVTFDDNENRLVHVKQGERVTIGQPKKYENCIHIYGPCTVWGAYVEDKHTIASYLQEKVNQAGFMYKVINHGGTVSGIQIIDYALATTFKEGDIVIVDRHGFKLRDIKDIDMLNVLAKNVVPAEWFVDYTRHCNYKVNKLIAEELFDKVVYGEQKTDVCNKRIIAIENDFVKRHYIRRYLKKGEFFDGKIGAIVMNCNPFTYGHKYLIEEACKRVDWLIVFVVEENKSVFSFAERYAMVCEGVSELKKVIVVPSGDYILSSLAFPEYFVKQADENLQKNVERDVTLFAKRIAPALNISCRFVGEEPEDGVTNEYNLAMKRILPDYGIEVIEIARKRTEEYIISASSVRRCLEAREIEQVAKLVPTTTERLLFMTND